MLVQNTQDVIALKKIGVNVVLLTGVMIALIIVSIWIG